MPSASRTRGKGARAQREIHARAKEVREKEMKRERRERHPRSSTTDIITFPDEKRKARFAAVNSVTALRGYS